MSGISISDVGAGTSASDATSSTSESDAATAAACLLSDLETEL